MSLDTMIILTKSAIIFKYILGWSAFTSLGDIVKPYEFQGRAFLLYVDNHP